MHAGGQSITCCTDHLMLFVRLEAVSRVYLSAFLHVRRILRAALTNATRSPRQKSSKYKNLKTFTAEIFSYNKQVQKINSKLQAQ
jgi:hypothetical protein